MTLARFPGSWRQQKGKTRFSLFASSSTEPPEGYRKFLAAPFFKKGWSFFWPCKAWLGEADSLAERFRFDTPVKTQKAFLCQRNKALVV